MSESPPALTGYLNGKFMPVSELSIPISDFGFTMGVTLTEQMRTWSADGDIALLPLHLRRFGNGLLSLGIELDIQQVEQAIDSVLERNRVHCEDGDALGIGLCATPGTSPRFADPQFQIAPNPATLLVYPWPLARSRDTQWREQGVSLASVDVTEVPAESVPKSIKSRSRLHYFLADRKAKEKSPGAMPLLCNAEGFVAECSTGSIGLIRNDTITFPPSGEILDSVGLRFLESDLGIDIDRKSFKLADCLQADAMIWLNAITGPLSVAKLDDHAFDQDNGLLSDLVQRWWQQVVA